MAIETEKRFLLGNDTWRKRIVRSTRIVQGYLSDDPERVVRVRIQDAEATITIKGLKTDGSGLEFEYVVPVSDAEQMLKLCNTKIEKTRHIVDAVTGIWLSELPDNDGNCNGVTTTEWEVDEFHGDNEGLVIAEFEHELGDSVHLPMNWDGTDITDNTIYANSNLAKLPYKKWDMI